MSNCPHEAWDFGALQCPDCGAVKNHVTDAEYAKLAAEAQALREEVAELKARMVTPEQVPNGYIGWVTQYPGRAAKLWGSREIAELNWWPEDGQQLFRVVEVERIAAQLHDALDESDGDRWKLRSERDAALAEVERLRQFERICEGLPQDAIDGCWTVQGIRCYAKRLEDQLKSALARVAELETALTPFAAVADAYDDSEDDDHEPYTDMGCDDRLRLTLGQHRAARTALSGAPSQAQHSVPEGWRLVPVEQLLNMMSDKDHDTRIMAERQLLAVLAAAPGKEGM